MQIEFLNEAEKDIKKLYKGSKKIAKKIISILKETSSVEKLKNVKKLVGDTKGRSGIKVDNCRIIFRIKENVMLIYVIKSRQEVYKWLKNN